MDYKTFLKRAALLTILFFLLDLIISVILSHGLNKYRGINERPDILINGSSMSLSAFDKVEIERLTRLKIAHYSHEGASIDARLAMIDYFFRKNPSSLKTVIYEVNPLIFSSVQTADNVYTIFYPYLDDRFMDRFVKERASKREYLTNKIIRTKRFDSRVIPDVLRGYISSYKNIRTATLDTVMILPLAEQWDMTEVLMEKSKIDVFEITMQAINSHKCEIILVMMPMYHYKFRTFNRDGYNRLCEYFENYSLSHQHITFLDLNQDSIINNSKYFSDPLHINVNGQQIISQIIGTYLLEN
jgi:hypothetical protein